MSKNGVSGERGLIGHPAERPVVVGNNGDQGNGNVWEMVVLEKKNNIDTKICNKHKCELDNVEGTCLNIYLVACQVFGF